MKEPNCEGKKEKKREKQLKEPSLKKKIKKEKIKEERERRNISMVERKSEEEKNV